MRYMRSLAMCCLGYRLSARQRHLVAKLGWPLEDEKEPAVGSLQSQIRPGAESRVVMKYNNEEKIQIQSIFGLSFLSLPSLSRAFRMRAEKKDQRHQF